MAGLSNWECKQELNQLFVVAVGIGIPTIGVVGLTQMAYSSGDGLKDSGAETEGVVSRTRMIETWVRPTQY